MIHESDSRGAGIHEGKTSSTPTRNVEGAPPILILRMPTRVGVAAADDQETDREAAKDTK
jgi:hypothetical protein